MATIVTGSLVISPLEPISTGTFYAARVVNQGLSPTGTVYLIQDDKGVQTILTTPPWILGT